MSTSSGPNRSRVLVTITPYNEQEKRVVSGAASTAGTATTTPAPTPATTATVPPPPAPPPLPLPAKTKNAEDAVEMQSIESFKLKETPNPVIPKPPPTYFPVQNNAVTSNGSPRHIIGPGVKPQVNGKDQSSPVPDPGKTVPSPTGNGKLGTGKVAIRIGAYEGEAKQPSRLDFLSQQPRPDKNGGEEVANGPVVSRLQNELAATLQRSNLRRKTDGEAQPATRPIPENASGNETTNSEPSKPVQSNVEKLASALSNKVTIKVNPDNNSR